MRLLCPLQENLLLGENGPLVHTHVAMERDHVTEHAKEVTFARVIKAKRKHATFKTAQQVCFYLLILH